MLSLMVWPKVITLGGFYCIWKNIFTTFLFFTILFFCSWGTSIKKLGTSVLGRQMTHSSCELNGKFCFHFHPE